MKRYYESKRRQVRFADTFNSDNELSSLDSDDDDDSTDNSSVDSDTALFAHLDELERQETENRELEQSNRFVHWHLSDG